MVDYSNISPDRPLASFSKNTRFERRLSFRKIFPGTLYKKVCFFRVTSKHVLKQEQKSTWNLTSAKPLRVPAYYIHKLRVSWGPKTWISKVRCHNGIPTFSKNFTQLPGHLGFLCHRLPNPRRDCRIVMPRNISRSLVWGRFSAGSFRNWPLEHVGCSQVFPFLQNWVWVKFLPETAAFQKLLQVHSHEFTSSFTFETSSRKKCWLEDDPFLSRDVPWAFSFSSQTMIRWQRLVV